MFKLNKHLLCFCLCLIFLLAYPSVFAQETLTITTYYPSPYGSYRQLSADQIAIGSTYRNPTYADGTLYVQGNVGIGTTGPNGKLQVRAAADENLIIGGHLTYSSGVLLNAANDAYGANVPMEFRASSFDFTVGNVGIGTTSPSSKLEVNGNLKISNTNGGGSGNGAGQLCISSDGKICRCGTCP